MATVEIIQGDITEAAVDAVVNAANNDLQLGGRTTAENLEASTRNSLCRAEEKQLRSIAFPAVGTGIAGFDTQRCAQIMLRVVSQHIAAKTSLERVVFVLFDAPTKKIFERTWRGMQDQSTDASN